MCALEGGPLVTPFPAYTFPRFTLALGKPLWFAFKQTLRLEFGYKLFV